MSNSGMRREVWDTNRENLRNQLRDIRLQADLTQIELAEKLSTTQAFISKYERGERNLDFIEVILVCKACGYSPENLINQFDITLRK